MIFKARQTSVERLPTYTVQVGEHVLNHSQDQYIYLVRTFLSLSSKELRAVRQVRLRLQLAQSHPASPMAKQGYELSPSSSQFLTLITITHWLCVMNPDFICLWLCLHHIVQYQLINSHDKMKSMYKITLHMFSVSQVQFLVGAGHFLKKRCILYTYNK